MLLLNSQTKITEMLKTVANVLVNRLVNGISADMECYNMRLGNTLLCFLKLEKRIFLKNCKKFYRNNIVNIPTELEY